MHWLACSKFMGFHSPLVKHCSTKQGGHWFQIQLKPWNFCQLNLQLLK